MTQDYAVVQILEEENYNQVAAHGFVTEDGAEEELGWIEDFAEGEYEVISYNSDATVELYHLGDSDFARSVTGAKGKA